MAQCSITVGQYAKDNGIEVSADTLKEMEKRFSTLLRKNPYMTNAQARSLIGKFFEADAVMLAEKNRAYKLQELKVALKGSEMIRDTRYGSSRYENIQAFITGKSDRVVKGGNRGVLVVSKGLRAAWRNQLMHAVYEHMELLQKGEYDRGLIHALGGATEMDGKAIHPVAVKVANIFNKIMADIFDQKKAVNPFLERIEDYYVRQTHDRVKILAANAKEPGVWTRDVLRLFGEKSFPDMTPFEQQARVAEILEAIDKDHYSSSFDKGEPGNKSYQMTRERKLIANDPNAFHEYMSKYGRGNVFETMLKTIDQAAHDIAVMEQFGAEPRKNIQRAIDLGLSDSPADKAYYDANKNRIRAQVDTVLGLASAPADSAMGKFTQIVLRNQAISKLPNVYVSLVDDLAKAITMIDAATGSNPATTTMLLTEHYMNGFFRKEYAREAARYVDVLVDSLNANVMAEMSGMDSLINADFSKLSKYDQLQFIMGRLAQGMSKLSLMEQHMRAASTAVGMTFNALIADMTHLPYDKLPKEVQLHVLERIGLDKHDWDFIRQHGVFDTKKEAVVSGKNLVQFGKLILAERLDAAPDSAIIDMIQKRQRSTVVLDKMGNPVKNGVMESVVPQRQILQERKRIVNSWRAAVNDMADMGTTTAGTHEFAFMHQGYSINTPAGQILRFLGNFKSSAWKSYNIAARLYHSGADPMRGNLGGMAKLVALGFGAYAIKKWATDAQNRKTPSDPSNFAQFLLPGLTTAFGAGPIVDSFLHAFSMDYNKYSSKLTAAMGMAGPVAEDAADVLDLGLRFLNIGDKKAKLKAEDIYGQMARIGINATPIGGFMRLPYLKGTMDYLVLDELHSLGNARFMRHEGEKMKRSAGKATEYGVWPQQDRFWLDPRR